MSSIGPIFDRAAVRRGRQRAAARGGGDFLRAEAVERLAERVQDARRPLEVVAELGARRGELRAALAAAGALPRTFVELDLVAPAPGRLGVLADEELLPLAAGRFDALFSVNSLHLVNDLPGTLVQMRRCLRPDGLLLAAFPGGGTLAELRQVLTQAELETTGGAGQRIAPFVDVRDAGALLQRAGFALPMADLERIEVAYASPLRLLDDLRAMGETGILARVDAPALGRAVLARALALYAEQFALPDGRLRATFEILMLTGWAPAPGQPRPARRGSGRIALGEALRPG